MLDEGRRDGNLKEKREDTRVRHGQNESASC